MIGGFFLILATLKFCVRQFLGSRWLESDRGVLVDVRKLSLIIFHLLCLELAVC